MTKCATVYLGPKRRARAPARERDMATFGAEEKYHVYARRGGEFRDGFDIGEGEGGATFDL